MAITINDNLFSESNKPQDAKYGPWGSLDLVKAGLPVEYRHRGLTVGVLTELGTVREYWFKAGVTDDYLVRKFSAEDLAHNDLIGDANLSIGGHHHYLTLEGLTRQIGSLTVTVDVGRDNIPSVLRRRNMRVSVHQQDAELPLDYILTGRQINLPAQGAQLIRTPLYEHWLERWTYQNGELTADTKAVTYFILRSGEPLAPGSRYCEVVFEQGQFKALSPAQTVTFQQLEQDEPISVPEYYTGEWLVRSLRPHTVYQNTSQPVSLAATAAYQSWELGGPGDNEGVWTEVAESPELDTSELVKSVTLGGTRHQPDALTGNVNMNAKFYDVLEVPYSVRLAVSTAAFQNGELVGPVPEGSRALMLFASRTDLYLCIRGYLGPLTWVRLQTKR